MFGLVKGYRNELVRGCREFQPKVRIGGHRMATQAPRTGQRLETCLDRALLDRHPDRLSDRGGLYIKDLG